MAYKRKYRRGDRITSVNELVEQEFVYLDSKIIHRGWFMSWSFFFAANSVYNGRVYYAVRNDGEKDG